MATKLKEKYEGHLDRVLIKRDAKFVVLEMTDVDWIESSGNYVNFHVNGHSYPMRRTMRDLDESLDPTHFVRIHRSTIVNVDRIVEIVRQENGELAAVLENGAQLSVGRQHRDSLSERFGGSL